MVHSLGRLLADFKLWHKIKRDSSAPITSVSEDDIVIFVVGPTGSGKSWFIKEATRSELVKSGRDYHPFTTKVQAIRCELTDEAKLDLKKIGVKSIVFIDIPSFHTECNYIDAQKEIKTWIDRIEKNPLYLGVIYMHRIETNPALEPIHKHLRAFTSISRLSNGYLPLHVHVVMSYDEASSNIPDYKIANHRSTLGTQINLLDGLRYKTSIHEVYFRGESEVAWGVVEDLFKQDSSGRTFCISEDDTVVFVVGPTGSGKSWFIKEVTKSGAVRSGGSYEPCTTKVQAIRHGATDEVMTDLGRLGRVVKSIVFVDVPSFLTECNDIDAQRETQKWINRIEHKPRYLGVIYMHRIANDPAHVPIQDHLREFASTIPWPRSPLRVHVVISHDKSSGTISNSKITKHEINLRAQIDGLSKSRWIPSIHPIHFQGEPEVAWRAVEDLIRFE